MPQVNSDHFAAVERNIGIILEHPIFEGIAAAAPIAINRDGDSGYKAHHSAFSASHNKSACSMDVFIFA